MQLFFPKYAKNMQLFLVKYAKKYAIIGKICKKICNYCSNMQKYAIISEICKICYYYTKVQQYIQMWIFPSFKRFK